MKKSILAFLCLASLTATAQTKKGDKLVGASIGGFSYTNSDSKTTYTNTPTVYNSDGSSFSISVNPNVAWFVQDNLAIGGGVSVSFYSSTSDNSNTSSTTTYESKSSSPSFYIGPLARYYFGGSPKGMPFVQADVEVGISGGKSETIYSTGTSSETTTKPKSDWNAGLSFGYEHFLGNNNCPCIGLFASIGFNYGSSKYEYEYRPSVGTGYDYTYEYSRFYIPVNVGIQVHILGKRK